MVSIDLIGTSGKFLSYHFKLTVDKMDPVSNKHITGMLLTNTPASLNSQTKPPYMFLLMLILQFGHVVIR